MAVLSCTHPVSQFSLGFLFGAVAATKCVAVSFTVLCIPASERLKERSGSNLYILSCGELSSFHCAVILFVAIYILRHLRCTCCLAFRGFLGVSVG